MSRRAARHCLALALLAAVAGAQPESEVILRGGAQPPEGRIVTCSIEGVVIASPVTGETVIGWDSVRLVTGDHADEARAFADVGDKAWRGLRRLERGDIPAAEPLLEGLFVTYRTRTGPTAAAVTGGLLRCRLERGAHTLAIAAWLSWMHARSADPGRQWFTGGSDAGTGPLGADEATGLLPDLPPIWLDLPAVRVFSDAPLGGTDFGDREQALAELYRHAARARCGVREPMPRLTSPDPGVHLVWDIVAAQSPSPQERTTGRKAIEVRLRKEPSGWLDAWLRVALGRSLLLEDDAEQRQRGVIELLGVRVMHERDSAYLAGLALADSVVALKGLGDDQAASMLRRELLDRFPGHPATGWEPIMVWEGAPSARMNQSTADAPGHAPRRVASVESRKPHG